MCLSSLLGKLLPSRTFEKNHTANENVVEMIQNSRQTLFNTKHDVGKKWNLLIDP